MKHAALGGEFADHPVAPCAGAWIETIWGAIPATKDTVAPCAGAWIETRHPRKKHRISRGRPLRGGVD